MFDWMNAGAVLDLAAGDYGSVHYLAGHGYAVCVPVSDGVWLCLGASVSGADASVWFAHTDGRDDVPVFDGPVAFASDAFALVAAVSGGAA